MMFALCIWGEKSASDEQIKRAYKFMKMACGLNTELLVFNNCNENSYYSLWLANNNKRQYELEHQTLFTGVMYVNCQFVDTFQPQALINKFSDRHTIYYHHSDGNVFYSDSLSGDYASLYVYNCGNENTLENDWLHHLRSYRLNLRKLAV